MEDTPPPGTLPKYLTEGVPKQGDETLRETRAYIDALLEYRTQSIDSDGLPDTADPIEESAGKGTV